MGELREIRWNWKSSDEDTRVGYLPMEGRMSIAELIDRMATLAPGVPLDAINVNWSTVTWERPATPEEIKLRRQQQARIARRHDDWEHQQWEKLRAKYGDR